MVFIKKINHYLFWPFSLGVTIFFCFLAKNLQEIGVILFTYIAIIVSLFILLYIVHNFVFTKEAIEKKRFDRRNFFYYTLLHLLFLFASLGLGVHFIGNRIILALLNYSAQIFIFGFGLYKSLKK